MALWGGRYVFEDVSITRRDYDEPGEGIRAEIPTVPPGIDICKYGKLSSDTITKLDYPAKERDYNPACRHRENLRAPRPLPGAERTLPRKELNKFRRQRFNSDPDDAYGVDQRHPTWPPGPKTPWRMPEPRKPYPHHTTLKMTGEHTRLTSTYTEDLGTVGVGDRADVELPPPGLQPFGSRKNDTEYKVEYSADDQRPRWYHKTAAREPAAAPRRMSQYPHWESTYTAFCRETTEAPSWIQDFLSNPPGHPLKTVPRLQYPRKNL